MVSLIATYLTTIGNYWQAVSDIASLSQVDDAYQMAEHLENCPMPDLAELLKMPCCHPCSSMPNPALKSISSLEAPPGRKTAPEPIEKAGGDAPPKTGPTVPPTTPAPAMAPPRLGQLGAPIGGSLLENLQDARPLPAGSPAQPMR